MSRNRNNTGIILQLGIEYVGLGETPLRCERQKDIPLKSQRNAEKRMLKDLININRNSPFDEIRRRILEGGLLRDSNLSPNMTTPEESLPNLA